MLDRSQREMLLDKNPITAELRSYGVSERQLASLRLRGGEGLPFASWSVWSDWDFPPSYLVLGRPYCALKWLLLDDPPWSRDRDDAWELVASTEAHFSIEAGVKSRERQSARAKKPRIRMPDDRVPLAEVVAAVWRKNRDLTAKQLWPHFVSALGERGLSPEERPSATNPAEIVVKYDFRDGRRRKLGLRRFENLVSAARHGKISR